MLPALPPKCKTIVSSKNLSRLMIAISTPRPILWAQPAGDKSGAHYLYEAAQQKAVAGLKSATAFQEGGLDTHPMRPMSLLPLKKRLATILERTA